MSVLGHLLEIQQNELASATSKVEVEATLGSRTAYFSGWSLASASGFDVAHVNTRSKTDWRSSNLVTSESLGVTVRATLS